MRGRTEKNLIINLIQIIILISISSCTPDTNIVNSTATPVPNIPTNTIAVETNTPVFTKTSNPTETATPEESTNPHPLENCVEIVENPDKIFPGVLVLHEGLLNLTTFQLQPFDVSHFEGASLVSPDGEKLAVISESDSLEIRSASGEVTKKYPVTGLTPLYWLDNSNLVLQETSFDRYDYGLPSYILNIETGSTSQVDAGVDQINTFRKNLGNYWYYAYRTRTSINPQASHLVFPRQDPHQLVVWDIENDKEIIRFPTFIGTSLPRWNSAGNAFLVSAESDFMNTKTIGFSFRGNDLFTIDIFGDIKRLSYISEIIPTYQHHYVWSPDEQKIAFLLEYDDHEMYGFLTEVLPVAILDLPTGQVVDLCITADLPPVWSPDGRYLAISDYIEGVFIIDLFEHKAYRVHDPEYWSIHGWLN